uniref:Uncharacterized protein n=1 Tax=viral metagenome TaxID=1070528 RepID=A0A6M3J357_9ZZZZ
MSVIQSIYAGGQTELVDNTAKLQLADVNISGAQQVGKIWWVNENSVMTISTIINNRVEVSGAELVIPFGDTVMSTPIEEIVDGKAVKTLRFQSAITTDETGIVRMQLPLKLPTGNYLISPGRINRGLEEIGAPFRFEFDPIDIDSLVVV